MAGYRNKRKVSGSQIANAHDITFKKTFGQVEIAKDLIKNNLPEEIIKDIDLNTLKRLDGSFISEDLKETFSDIIYEVKVKNREAYIALLLEHKSYPDKLAVFQVSRYIIDLWSRLVAEGKKQLPIVIPIVVYHGRRRWNYSQDTREMISNFTTLPSYLKERMPVLKHDFIDISKQNEDAIRRYDPVVRLVVRSFKHIYSKKRTLLEYFLISMEEIPGEEVNETLFKLVENILAYYSLVDKEMTEDEIHRKIRELEGKGEKIMNIFELREQRGIEKGREEGIEKGRRQEKVEMAKSLFADGVEIPLIIRYTKLTEEEVREITRE